MIHTILLIILIVAFALISFKLLFWPYNKQWESLFQAGKAPETLLGPNGVSQDWSVRMVTGPILSMDFWPLRHRKRFYKEWGENLFFKDIWWGMFTIKPTPGVFELDYKGKSFTRFIIDHIRTTPNPNVMIGKFYYKLFGKYRFFGFFTLTRRF